MKIIENNKDYFDQSVDEIKLLRYINANCEDLDSKNLLKLIDFFYHKEHLFIVPERGADVALPRELLRCNCLCQSTEV